MDTEEFARLISAFNAMLAQLQVRDVELRRHRDHLGELIAQRTAELMEASHALFDARDSAEAANRAKTVFLANMSHELRTPLTAIIGYSELLIEEEEEAGHAENLPSLKNIHLSGRHLLEVINEVLDLSQIEAGKMQLHLEDFDFVTLLREVETLVSPAAKKNANTLHLELPATPVKMRADRTKVRQAVLNLAANACKFTRDGRVELLMALELRDDVEWIQLTVRDTGIGMTPEQVSRLFQVFTQVDAAVTRKYGGSGLGLALSKRFIEAHGGHITCTSAPERGSTFVLRVPLQPLGTPARSPREAADILTKPVDLARLSSLVKHHVPQPDARPILVVEDDELQRQLLKNKLEKEGFAVMTAAHGRAALDEIQLRLPAVILLDPMMPEMDGFEFAHRVRNRPDLRDVPIIVLTGKTLTAEEHQRLTGSVTTILSKENTSHEALHHELRTAFTKQAK